MLAKRLSVEFWLGVILLSGVVIRKNSVKQQNFEEKEKIDKIEEIVY